MLRSLRSLAVLLVLATAIPLSAASAHPRLLKATPAADSRSATPPRQVALTFNESLDLALTRVTLLRGETAIKLAPLQLLPHDDMTVVADIGTALAPGKYTVRWQVTGDDGHPVKGEFSFEVVAASSAPARPSRP